MMTGKSKSVIHKALKNGTISNVGKDESGYKIDPSELFRVFPQNGVLERGEERNRTAENGVKNGRENAPDVSALAAKVDLLQERLHDKDERIAELKEERDYWKTEKDRWHEQAQRLMLTYNPATKPPALPVEAENAPAASDTVVAPETTPSKAHFAIYGLVLFLLLAVTAAMNYFQSEVKALIDDAILGKVETATIAALPVTSEPLEPAENAEPSSGERVQEPRQSFPPSVFQSGQ